MLQIERQLTSQPTPRLSPTSEGLGAVGVHNDDSG